NTRCHLMLRRILLTLASAALALATATPRDEKTDPKPIRDAVTLYAAFDEEVKADFSGGELTLSTRKGDLRKKNCTVEKGFNDKKPRDMRMGVFPAVGKGEKGNKEDDPKAPMVWLRKVKFEADEWHHVVLTWKNFDTGKPDAVATLYVDGKKIGDVKDRAIAM